MNYNAGGEKAKNLPVQGGEVEDDGDEDVRLLVERTLSALLLPIFHFLSQSLPNAGAWWRRPWQRCAGLPKLPSLLLCFCSSCASPLVVGSSKLYPWPALPLPTLCLLPGPSPTGLAPGITWPPQAVWPSFDLTIAGSGFEEKVLISSTLLGAPDWGFCTFVSVEFLYALPTKRGSWVRRKKRKKEKQELA